MNDLNFSFNLWVSLHTVNVTSIFILQYLIKVFGKNKNKNQTIYS